MSIPQFTVAAQPGDAPAVAPVIASLPVSLAWSDEPDLANIVFVSGEGDWVSAASQAIDAGARGVVVGRPTVIDPGRVETLATLADRAGVTVTLAEPFASNAAIAALAEAVVGRLGDVRSVVAFSTERSGRQEDVLLTQVRIIRALGILGFQLTSAARQSKSTIVSGLTDGGLHVSATVAIAPATRSRHTIRLYGPETTIELDVFDRDTARPAYAAIIEHGRGTALPSLYESADRTAWRAAVAAVAAGGSAELALRDFAADVRSIGRVSAAGGS